MVVRASFLNGFGWFLPPLYFQSQISTLKIIEPNVSDDGKVVIAGKVPSEEALKDTFRNLSGN